MNVGQTVVMKENLLEKQRKGINSPQCLPKFLRKVFELASKDLAFRISFIG